MAQPLTPDDPLLMIVAKAVAGVPPTCTDRLDGNTAATSGLGPELEPSDNRPICPAPVSVNQIAPSGPVASWSTNELGNLCKSQLQ
jgi:hypothetical protein